MRVFVLHLAMLLAGCVSSPPARIPEQLFADGHFAPPLQSPDTSGLFAASQAMRAYLAGPLAQRVRERGPLLGLLEALREDVRLEYDAATTRTAAEVFEARSGNCLSLVIMASVFARELGIPAQIQSVHGSDTWMRAQGISIRSGHVNLVLGPRRPDLTRKGEPPGPLIVDFLPVPDGVHWAGRAIADETVVAMYANNRAAEALLEGDTTMAYWWARTAIAESPRYLPAYNTLAVAYMRNGYLSEAEQTLRHSLEREPENVETLTNLALVLSRQERGAEAEAIRRQLARIAPHPPYHFLDLGLAALARGDTQAAAELIGKELQRMPYDDEVNLAFAVVSVRLGDVELAREYVRRAVDNSPTQARRNLYASKLRYLESLRDPR